MLNAIISPLCTNFRPITSFIRYPILIIIISCVNSEFHGMLEKSGEIQRKNIFLLSQNFKVKLLTVRMANKQQDD